MVDTVPRTGAATALPDHAVVPPVWGRITNLDVDRGEGSWLITRDGRALPRLLLGDRRHQHRARPPAGRRGGPGAGGEAAPRPAEHPVPRARAPAVRPAAQRAARRPVAGVPVELRRGGGRGLGQAGPRRDRPAGDHGLPLRLPRPDRPDDGAHDRQGRLPRRPSSRCPGSVYHTAYPYCYRAPGGAHAPDACTCDWEAAARPDVPPVHLPGPGRGDHPGAGPRRGRLHRAAAGVPAPPPRDHPPARDPAHRRRGPDRASAGPARCSRCATGTSSPTSWSWPRASPRACRSPASWPGPS